jgi:hypothetical protein
MTPLRLTLARLGQVAAMATTALTLWACSEQASLTSPPRPLTPEGTPPAFNVVAPTQATAVLCTQGPAGTYNYTISLNIPQTFVLNGNTVDYGAANIALVQTPAYETITVGNVSNTAGTCQTIGTIFQSLNFPAGAGVIADPERFLTITQTSGPAQTALDFIITTQQGGSDVTIPSPATAATIAFNFYHGAVASFWNTLTPIGNQGCTPGYWKQSQHFDSWVGYTQSQLISSVFTVPGAYSLKGTPMGNFTLLQGLSFKGGSTLSDKAQILFRAAISALLNSSNPSVNYGMTTAQIISAVNAALASLDENQILTLAAQLDGLNNALGGCPLN